MPVVTQISSDTNTTNYMQDGIAEGSIGNLARPTLVSITEKKEGNYSVPPIANSLILT